MATTYSLKITQMDCLPQAEGQQDVVVCAHWAYTATLDGRTAGMGGTTTLSYTDGAPFTPFDQLTEEQVAGWVLAAWSAEETAARQELLDQQLAIATPAMPWGTGSELPPVA